MIENKLICLDATLRYVSKGPTWSSSARWTNMSSNTKRYLHYNHHNFATVITSSSLWCEVSVNKTLVVQKTLVLPQRSDRSARIIDIFYIVVKVIENQNVRCISVELMKTLHITIWIKVNCKYQPFFFVHLLLVRDLINGTPAPPQKVYKSIQNLRTNLSQNFCICTCLKSALFFNLSSSGKYFQYIESLKQHTCWV